MVGLLKYVVHKVYEKEAYATHLRQDEQMHKFVIIADSIYV